jgi:multiple sugar transport system substrate-binding protein
MKKGICCFLVVLMSLGLLFGNGSSENATPKESSAASPTTIELWYHISPNQAKILLEMVAKFEAANPTIKVETQSVAFAEIKKQLTIGAAARQLPDVTLCDTVDNASFAAAGVAVDITDEVNAWGEINNYFDAPRTSATYNGRYYGLPYYSNCLAIMYNKDIFDEMGIPYPTNDWTWDDFKKLVAQTTTPNHYGLTMSLIKSEEGTFNVLPFIWQAGGDWDNFASPEAMEAITMINDFYQKGYMSKELISMTQADMCSSLFCTGKSAMMVAGSWLRTNIKNENPNLNYGVVTYPTNKNAASCIGGGNIMMLKPDHKDASWKLMAFLSEKENSLYYNEQCGYISSRKDAVEMSELWKNDPVLSVYAKQLAVAKARGPHPRWPEISSALQEAFQSVLSNSATVQNAMQKAADKVSKIK